MDVDAMLAAIIADLTDASHDRIAVFYGDSRQSRIDAALDLLDNDLRAAGKGRARQTRHGYVVTENGKTRTLTEAQFVALARARGCFAQDDPFFARFISR